MSVEVCRNGHIRTPENIYLAPNGNRQCLDCKKVTQAKYMAKRKENAKYLLHAPEFTAIDVGYTESKMSHNLKTAFTLADTIKTARVKRGSFSKVGAEEGKNGVSLQEMEANLKKRLKAVARYCDIVGIDISFAVVERKEAA